MYSKKLKCSQCFNFPSRWHYGLIAITVIDGLQDLYDFGIYYFFKQCLVIGFKDIRQ